MRAAGARLALGALTAAAALAVAAPAGGAGECDGLQVCIPIAGPWVVVPTATGASRPQAPWQLICPRGFIVGGLDARLSQRGIDVTFLGRLGSPVNPGITTSRSVTFLGSYVGTSPRSPTFKPFVGCMPTRGGGSRVPTSVSQQIEPGAPATWRTRTVRVRPGRATVSVGCRGGERLVGASHAFGFFTRTPPGASLVSSVRGDRAVRDGRVVVAVRGDAEVGSVRAVVQVQAVCAGAR